jgi:hypothetical protein
MNHGYNTPPRGAVDWDRLLNENFESLDVDVEIRGEEETLDEYEPKSGAFFLATDTGNGYVGEGDRWRPLSTISESPEFESVTTDQLLLKRSSERYGDYSRPLVSTEERYISVGPGAKADTASLKRALKQVPILLRHNYTIALDPSGGPYGPAVVPTCLPLKMADSDKGDTAFLRIAGNDGQSAGIGRKSEVNGMYLGASIDTTYVRDIRLVGENPYDDLSSCVSVFNGQGHLFSHVDIGETTANHAFHAQSGAYVDVRECDLGEDNVAYGCRARGAATTIQARGFTGTAGEAAFVGFSGSVFVRNNSATGRDSTFRAQRGMVYDTDSGDLYGPTSLAGREG